MSEMVARVAKAIFDRCPELDGEFDDYGSLVQLRYFNKARAAIETMREPTDEMKDAALAAQGNPYQAMK